jgi:hypothetical protein
MRDVLPRESPRRGTILEAEVEAGRGDEPGPRECALYFRKNNSEAAFMTVRLPKAPGTVAALLLIALNKFDEFINKGAGLNAPPRVAVSTFAGGNIVTHARITHKHVMVSPEARVRFEGRQADVVVSALWEVGNENALAARLAEAVRRHLTALDVWTKPLRLARAPEDAVDRQLMAARLADLAALLRVALERELTRAEVVFAKKTCEVCFEGEVMHRLDGFLPVWFGPRAGGASPFLARLARRLDLDPNSEVVDLVKRQAVALTIACHRLQSAVSDDSRASSPATPPAAPPSARAAGETQLARMIGGLVDALVEGGADVVFSGDVGLRAKPVREVQGYVFCADADAWAAALSARLRDESELRLVMLHRRAIVRWGAETLGSLALMPASRFEETALRVARTDHLDCAVARINVDTDDRLLVRAPSVPPSFPNNVTRF